MKSVLWPLIAELLCLVQQEGTTWIIQPYRFFWATTFS